VFAHVPQHSRPLQLQPPTAPEEVRAASLQYVRKVSGLNKPSLADEDAFESAVREVTAATERLLAPLRARPVRKRGAEQARAKERWTIRALSR